jgi:glycosyltransferase involved in cell wall biosynthesis
MATVSKQVSLQQFRKKHSTFKIVPHIGKLNLGGTLKTGFVYAKGDYLFTVDLDLSDSP